jgi:phage-related protein
MSKVLMILRGEIKTPPMSRDARREAGLLLRSLQEGELLSMPHSRPMPIIGTRCHELRVNEAGGTWRVIYRVDPDAVLVLDVYEKKTRTTPDRVIQDCRKRLKRYDEAARG